MRCVTIFTAVQEQLGLKLERRRVTTEMFASIGSSVNAGLTPDRGD